MTKRNVKLSLNPCALKGPDRGGRSSRLGMFATLFTLVWAPLFALFKFLAILGFAVGAGTAFVGVLGGVGLLVLVGWFLVNLLMDATSMHDPNYRLWRKSGGDPYFDLTWFWPLNTDSDAVRRGQYILCPNQTCGQRFPKYGSGGVCPHCQIDNMDFLRCGACGESIFDPNRLYDQQCGIQCPGCGLISRDPSQAHLPVIQPGLPPTIPDRRST
jgi:hypothetical protein